MRKIFNTISVLILLSGAFVAILPTVVMPDLIYPQRIDSAYVAFQRSQFTGEQHQSEVFFNPKDLNLAYENMNVLTSDSIMLKGWYIPLNDSDASTLVVIHDINESKIKYLNLARQLHDRGLNVCLFDLRAHGNSEGRKFSPGLVSVNDVRSVLDSLLQKQETKHIVLMGIGIGAGIALQTAALDERCEVLVLQCPYNNFTHYLQRYSEREWKNMRGFYMPVLKRKLYLVLQQQEDLVLSDICANLNVPSFFIAAVDDSITPPSEARALFDTSAAERKDFVLVRKANHDNVEIAGGEAYYNSITEFINEAIPKKAKKVRNKKLT